MRGRVGLASVAAVAAIGLVAGCGSTSEASKSPRQILADAASAIRGAGSYVVQGSLMRGGNLTSVKLSVSGPGSVDFVFTTGPRTAELIEDSGADYLLANAAFWRALSPLAAARAAGHWVRLPASSLGSLPAVLSRYEPSILSRCLSDTRGTLRAAGTATVAGRRAILIDDAGDVPGSTPTSFEVAATGPHYLLRVATTGPYRPGGSTGVCHTGSGAAGPGTVLTLSDYGRVPAIKAPSPVLNPTGG